MSRWLAGVALAASLTASTASAQVKIRYEEYTLPNGLRVLLAEDHSTPVVTVDVWYRVGSRDEQPGHTGFAHMFEQLMFHGSEHVADGQHYRLVDAAGGDVTANANEERSAFSETLPSNQLALGLWLEADRMRSLKINEQVFEGQKQQVQQERQMRVDNQPYGAAFLDGLTAAFDATACFGYSHSVLGFPEDLENAQASDAEAFFKAHYVPNRATLTLTGDFEPAEAKRLVQSYFGAVPKGTTAVPDAACKTDYASGEKSNQMVDALAETPAVILSYRVPPHADPDSRALQLLASILGQGEGSRLRHSLVQEQKVASQATAGIEMRQGPGLLYAYAIASPGTSSDAARKALGNQIGRLSTDLTKAEVDRAKVQLRATTYMGRQTTYQLAEDLQHFASQHQSVEEINTDLDRYAALTVEDLKRAAAKYFTAANTNVLVVNPASGGDHGDGRGHGAQQ